MHELLEDKPHVNENLWWFERIQIYTKQTILNPTVL